jgi:hypothetical protein
MKYRFLLLFVVVSVFLILGCPPYEETQYRVYYNGNGATEGSPPTDSNYYNSGETATVLGKGNLKKNDYAFLGWRYYNVLYYEGEKITISYDDVNLYAVWDDGINTPFSFKVEDNGEVTITRYNEQYSNSVTIPDTLQSKPVTAIDDTVFSNLSIKSVTLPKNLKKIGISAFASNNITQIIIPNTVESIGLSAFRYNKLQKITLGTGIIALEPYTFSNNNLTDITIPGNIVSIGTGAFNGNAINMIKIGAGVDIGNDAALGTYGATFKAYYDADKEAGTYIYNDTSETWERH